MLIPFPSVSSPGIFAPRKSEFVSLCTEDCLKGWNHFSDPWCGITFPTPGVGITFPTPGVGNSIKVIPTPGVGKAFPLLNSKSSNIHLPLTGITQGVKLADELGCHS